MNNFGVFEFRAECEALAIWRTMSENEKITKTYTTMLISAISVISHREAKYQQTRTFTNNRKIILACDKKVATTYLHPFEKTARQED